MLEVEIVNYHKPKVSLASFDKPSVTIDDSKLKPLRVTISTLSVLYAEIKHHPLEVTMIKHVKPKVTISQQPLTVSGGNVSTNDQPKVYYFTANDLVNERITRNHNFNTDVVDVTVYDSNGRMIGCDVSITRTTVTLNLTRVTVIGTWKMLVEKI